MAQRYKFESKSQLDKCRRLQTAGCFQWLKGTNLKANHNKDLMGTTESIAVSNGSKVQIWKQITTDGGFFTGEDLLFPMAQRYKFESKSQPGCCIPMHWSAVSNGSKVQIWKQITTHPPPFVLFLWLFPMAQRYKFESKSQRMARKPAYPYRCFQWLKGTNLKANHNAEMERNCPS